MAVQKKVFPATAIPGRYDIMKTLHYLISNPGLSTGNSIIIYFARCWIFTVRRLERIEALCFDYATT